MLDVHPPEHGIHGVRDFFIHLLTITVGLLIALGLEAGAEAAHHRHQRIEAENNIRAEIRDNRNTLRQEAPSVITEAKNMARMAHILEARSQGQPGSLKGISIRFGEDSPRDAAWATAASTGALTYMDYGGVERFSDAYREQKLLQTTEEQALDDYLQLQTVVSGRDDDLSPALAKDALPLARRALAHLNGMLDVGQGTLTTYDEALK
jgi:hypothetical protein